ncbi:Glycosyl transferase group 1 [Rhodotorula toruloides ATCC 204091]|uniref:Glycosyl transferase group 1 n=1 Tax=Rhodotorula toruloides TaxID=5286 RepID=A0A0K3C8S8_RHOTO|nr:Glycosyl transferase group 1 [Rhodotorula toruloides ATCC 204091]KAK4335536.1 Glycosyl transferase group 1 [Rhodotorula toruloides]PRQ78144.1 glycosyl transferase group 1 [Rhodotorula toruloides]
MSAATLPALPKPLSGRELDLLEKANSSTPTGASNGQTTERRALRIAIVTENFLPKIDGVTRTLAMLLEHLQAEGHEALVLGPASTLTSYAGAEVVSTKGIPLLGVYRGLGLNFLRPRFIRKLREFKPDIIQFTDPIWLCAQTIPMVQYYFPDTPLVSSYHTNLAMYATLFGFSWLTPVMWSLQRNLHGRCHLSFCPSPSTARMLEQQGFQNLRIWPRGVDVEMFRPEARDYALRQRWGVEPQDLDADRPSPRVHASDNRIPCEELPPLNLPPPYSAQPAASTFSATSPSKLVVLYVGRISWEKNLRLLIEAYRGLEEPDLATNRPACQLIFVGDGPARAEAESLCKKYGLDALFLGFKKGEQLAAAYASADIFAFPSFTETFGQVVSEAQASGLPVVGLKAEGVSDLVDHGRTGLLLDLNALRPAPSSGSQPPAYSATPSAIPSDPHALLDLSSPTFPAAVALYRSLIASLATDPEQRRTMAATAHDVASKRSWFGAMEQLVDGYRDLTAARDARLAQREKDELSLSRTSTIEFDVVCDAGAEKVDGETAQSTGASTPQRRRRLLRLDGVFKRSGRRFQDGSVSLTPLKWLAPKPAMVATNGGIVLTASKGEDGASSKLMVHLLEGAVFFCLLYVAVSWMAQLEAISFIHV